MKAPPEIEDKVKILAVDDEPSNLFVIREILNDPSYEVITSSDPSQALKQLLAHEFALLLLDVFMEGMDGLELASLVKSREKSRRTPIIFLTAARADMDFIHRAYGVGAADFIEKPLEPEILRAKVAVFIDLYRKTKEVKRQSELLRESELRERDAQLAELRVSGEKRYQDLVEGIDHGFVWSADPESLSFTYVSPRAELILGYPIREWKERVGFWLDHVPSDDRPSVENLLKSAQTGKDLSLDHRFLRSNGETVWLHTAIRLARRGPGAGIELRGLSMDISDLKEIEEALKAAVHARDEFLSIASHELRTPLTPMVLQLQLLEKAVKSGNEAVISPERLTKTLDSWRRQLSHLSRLVEDMLDFSRIPAGHLQLNRTETNLRSVVDDVIDRYRPALARAECEVRVSASEHVTGLWDAARLEQVFTNLLTNAIKYAPGMPVDIELSDNGDSTTLIVRDHGGGIPADKQAKIFDRFERGTSASYISGLGLGLYIARSIVVAHGGQISVSSEAGKGATFIVTLPKQAAMPKSA